MEELRRRVLSLLMEQGGGHWLHARPLRGAAPGLCLQPILSHCWMSVCPHRARPSPREPV